MKYLKFVWAILTGRTQILPKSVWITAQHRENFTLWHGRELNIPVNYVRVMEHGSYDAMCRWLEGGNNVVS